MPPRFEPLPPSCWARRARVLAGALAVAGSAWAQAPSAATQQEIEQLFSALQQSNCQFQRNGSWYDAAKAADHLRQKYDYLRKRDMADTAELFIERAASESSMSGKPYHVQCAGHAVEPSAQWFKRRLQALRAAPAAH